MPCNVELEKLKNGTNTVDIMVVPWKYSKHSTKRARVCKDSLTRPEYTNGKYPLLIEYLCFSSLRASRALYSWLLLWHSSCYSKATYTVCIWYMYTLAVSYSATIGYCKGSFPCVKVRKSEASNELRSCLYCRKLSGGTGGTA